MIIKVEPRDWNMASVFLLFDAEQPDSEDEKVRSYLDERGLQPKRTRTTQVDDRECDVWSFGSCYLGPHLHEIAEIQRKTLEREALAAKIALLIQDWPEGGARETALGMGEDELSAAVDGLIDEYHRDSSFATDDDGRTTIALDPAEVQASFLKLVSPRR